MWWSISQVTHGVRQVVLCKDADGKIGLRVKAVNKGSHHRFEQLFSWRFPCAGVFVCLVTKGSPAALGGLRFGDQILQVDGVNLAGFSSDKVLAHLFPLNSMLLLTRCMTCWKRLQWTTSRWPSEIDPLRGLSLSTRYLIKIFDSRRVSFSIKLWQRPSLIVKGQLWPKYSLKLTCGHSISFNVQDSTGHIGFQFKDGKITSIVVDSSAARFLTPSRTQFCNFPHKYFYPLL